MAQKSSPARLAGWPSSESSGAQGSSRPAHPSDQISGAGPGVRLGFAVRGPQPGTGSWESSPDERGRITCPPMLVIPAMDAFWKVLWSRKTPLPRAPPAPGICGSRSTNLPLTLNADGRTLHRGASPAASPAFRPGLWTPAGPSHTLTFVCITEALLPPLPKSAQCPPAGGGTPERWAPPLSAYDQHPASAEDQHPAGVGVLKAGQGAESV